jgi:predicted phosphodiesterase
VPYLILSDIHANLEALKAVLSDARGRYEQILCLGDLVGYGADPNAVLEWARANVTVAVRGNHDKACLEPETLEYFRPMARAAAIWTREVLTPENLRYLETLPRGPLHYDGFDLVHGSPVDEDEYLFSLSDVAQIRSELQSGLLFFGHTHVQGGFLVSRNGVKSIEPIRELAIEANYSYLLNPGSVGQPRDGDPRAAYAIYSPRERVVEYHRVSYSVAQAAAKILTAGLPESLAARLYEGV